jgi:hypothetical protein
MYRKIKRTWSSGYTNYEFNRIFKDTFPELKLDNEELCNRLRSMGLEYYSQKVVPVRWWVRLTLPLGALAFIVMLLVTPINFMLTGSFSYDLKEKNFILNWFRELQFIN